MYGFCVRVVPEVHFHLIRHEESECCLVSSPILKEYSDRSELPVPFERHQPGLCFAVMTGEKRGQVHHTILNTIFEHNFLFSRDPRPSQRGIRDYKNI